VPIRANPFHVAPVGSTAVFASPNMQGAAVVPTIANTMVVWLWTTSDNSTTGAAAGGATAAYSGASYDSIVGTDASTFAAYKLQATAASTGIITIAASSGSTTGLIRFALDPTPSTVNLSTTTADTLGLADAVVRDALTRARTHEKSA